MPFVADFYPKKSLQTRMRKTPATNQLQMIFEKKPLKFVAEQEKTPEKSGVLARHRGFEPLAFGSVGSHDLCIFMHEKACFSPIFTLNLHFLAHF